MNRGDSQRNADMKDFRICWKQQTVQEGTGDCCSSMAPVFHLVLLDIIMPVLDGFEVLMRNGSARHWHGRYSGHHDLR